MGTAVPHDKKSLTNIATALSENARRLTALVTQMEENEIDVLTFPKYTAEVNRSIDYLPKFAFVGEEQVRLALRARGRFQAAPETDREKNKPPVNRAKEAK